MSLIIRLYKITAFILWIMAIILITAPYRFRRGWHGIRTMSRFAHLWTKGVAKIINLRVTVSGEIPSKEGCLVVSNHLSYVDIIAHGSVLTVRHSPKTDIAKWPLLGWYLGLSRPIWVDRRSRQASKKALMDFADTMKNGIHLIVYPEGTSSDGKNGLLPFKSTPFEAAIEGNVPVVPVITRYKEAPGMPEICWYGDMTLLPHAWQVLGSPHIDAEIRFLPPVLPEGRSRKELASYVHDIMSREYV